MPLFTIVWPPRCHLPRYRQIPTSGAQNHGTSSVVAKLRKAQEYDSNLDFSQLWLKALGCGMIYIDLLSGS